ELFAIGGEQRLPTLPRRGTTRANPGIELLEDLIWHEKLRVLRPTIGALREPDLFFAQGLAMDLCRIHQVRRAIADMAIENDQSRPALGLVEERKSILDAPEIVRVADPQDVPLIGEEPCCDVLSEGDACLAFNGDVVVIVDPAQIIETKMARQRGRL